jgi:hypothetical protein
MSAMVNLEIPWINVMSKMDLVTSNPEDPSGGARNGFRGRRNIARCEYVPNFFKYRRGSCERSWCTRRAVEALELCGLHRSLFIIGFPSVFIHIFFRYLDPDPLLLASARGQEVNSTNPRFHALNQAIVQLVSGLFAAVALHVLTRAPFC